VAHLEGASCEVLVSDSFDSLEFGIAVGARKAGSDRKRERNRDGGLPALGSDSDGLPP
jgi:hypothetical protein